MIKKTIITTVILTSFIHANIDTTNHNKTIETNMWKSNITNIETGESCDDGNCLDDLGCFTKDGPMYKAVKSVRKSVKKLCAKL